MGIKVVGVGGAGCRVVRTILDGGLESVGSVFVSDEDMPLPRERGETHRIALGKKTKPQPFSRVTPEWGRRFVLEQREEIRRAVLGGDPVLLVAGLGGGLGTGALPVIARIGKELDALTIALVSTPFPFEGEDRSRIAHQGLDELALRADLTVVIPNARAVSMMSSTTTISQGYATADEIMVYGVRGLVELIRHGEWGLADGEYDTLKSFLRGSGEARLGMGASERLLDALRQALASPLLEHRLGRARKVVVSLAPSGKTAMSEVEASKDWLRKRLRQDAETALSVLPAVPSRPWVFVAVYAAAFEPLESPRAESKP